MCPVRLDPRLTATALAHLLENAAQYSPPGSTIEVTSRASADEGLVIQVRDHGPGHRAGGPAASVRAVLSRRRGADADVRHRYGPVDRPRAAGRRRTDGCGPRTAPDGGAQFTLVVPARRRTDAESASSADMIAHRPRILLVDDEVAIQRAVGPLLRSRGYEVDIAGTGAQALALFAERHAGSDRARPWVAGPRRHRSVSPHSGDIAGADHRVVSARSGGRQGERARSRRRRLRHQAIRSGRTAGAHSRGAAARTGRRSAVETGVFRAGALTIDYDRRRVVRDGTEIRLTPKEFDLLSLLARNHDRVLDAPRHSEGGLGAECGRAAGTPVDAGCAAPEEDRTRSGEPRIPPERAVGRLSVRDREP